MPTKKKNKKKVGRPAIKFDTTSLRLMGRFKATYETMADYYGCSIKTIERNMNKESSRFSRVYKKEFARTKMKLSETQLKYALKGNATLLIWLGKQYLGQTDEIKMSHQGINLKDFANEMEKTTTTMKTTK